MKNSKYKKRYRRYKKKYRSLARRSRKIHKKQKRIRGRSRLPGMSMRVNNRPENKYQDYGQPAAQTIPTTAAGRCVIYSTDPAAVDTLAAIMWPQIVQGTGLANCIGTKINWRYFDIRFSIRIALNTAFQDTVRVLVMQQRNDNLFIVPNSNVIGQGQLMAPVETKEWKIFFDKAFQFTTGRSTNPVIGTDSWNSQYSLAKHFRFLVPFRCTATVVPGETQANSWKPPLVMTIVAYSQFGQCVVDNVYVRRFFRDP